MLNRNPLPVVLRYDMPSEGVWLSILPLPLAWGSFCKKVKTPKIIITMPPIIEKIIFDRGSSINCETPKVTSDTTTMSLNDMPKAKRTPALKPEMRLVYIRANNAGPMTHDRPRPISTPSTIIFNADIRLVISKKVEQPINQGFAEYRLFHTKLQRYEIYLFAWRFW